MLCLTWSNVVQGAGVHAARHGGDTVARRAQVGLSQRRHRPGYARVSRQPTNRHMAMWSMQWMTTVLQDPVGTCVIMGAARAGGDHTWDGVGGSCKKKCYTEDFFRGLTFQRNFDQISLKLVPADESLKFGGSC